MDRPEASPRYLAHCLEEFLEAMSEARTLALRDGPGPALAETARFASDLLDIIAEGVALLPTNAESDAMLEDLRGQVKALGLFLQRSLH